MTQLDIEQRRRKHAAAMQRWAARHRERAREDCREYYRRNKEKIRTRRQTKAYRDRCAAQMREKRKEIGFRILCNLRLRVWHAVKNSKGTRKCARTVELVGCTVEDLREHLQGKFTDGMSWENYGDWHIDHIRPCAKFDLSIPEQQRLCFHFSNLQPLWSVDNRIKSDKEIVCQAA